MTWIRRPNTKAHYIGIRNDTLSDTDIGFNFGIKVIWSVLAEVHVDIFDLPFVKKRMAIIKYLDVKLNVAWLCLEGEAARRASLICGLI